MQNVLTLRTEPLPVVRIGLIGLGHRGMKTLQRYRFLRHAQICAVADLDETKLLAANEELRRSGRPEARTFVGEDGWKALCRYEEVDLVYICTDWDTHTRMAVEAMRQGKHTAVEVPAATTVEDCRLLVSTAEETRRHCFMTENCCYDSFSLSVLEMKRRGLLGRINHCEGAYIHNLREEPDNTGAWMEKYYRQHGGNPYPTHGMGPIGWLLNIHRGDRLDYLVSLTSDGGQVNNTLIKTASGASILLQLDVTTHRPYSRLQTVCGTKGFAQKYPLPTLQFDQEKWEGTAALKKAEEFSTSDAAKRWKRGHELGTPNEMNYAMDSRLIHCLHHGLPLDIDVYDAAEWSCIAELSRQSALEGSRPVAIPDFTGGHWNDLQEHRLF